MSLHIKCDTKNGFLMALKGSGNADSQQNIKLHLKSYGTSSLIGDSLRDVWDICTLEVGATDPWISFGNRIKCFRLASMFKKLQIVQQKFCLKEDRQRFYRI